MPAKLTRVKLKDYRSIAQCDVELQPLTLLVGPNGAGKSNFLDSLRFLSEFMLSPLDHVLTARSGLTGVLRKLPNGAQCSQFSISVDFVLADETKGSYSLTVGGDSDGNAKVKSEHCQLGPESFTNTNGVISQTVDGQPAFRGDRPALLSFGGHPKFAPAFHMIAGMTFYAPESRKMKRPISMGPGTILASDGSNAADVLFRLQWSHPEVVRRLLGYLRSFNPEFQDASVAEVDGMRWLRFTPSANPSDWRINGWDVSDGTLRALAILLAVFQSASAAPPVSLICLEEPENNLHPAAAGVLLDALLEGSLSVSVIASTHSADMLDRHDLPANSILAVALQNGESIIGPIDESGTSILRKHLYTAGELLRSNRLMPERGITATQ